MRWCLIILLTLGMVGCDYVEEEREVGYKGKARINPWLAAERFSQNYTDEVKSMPSWQAPASGDALLFVPASILGNRGYVRQVERWVLDGGHLVVLVDYSQSETNDWHIHSVNTAPDKSLTDMLGRAGLTLTAGEGSSRSEKAVTRVTLEGRSYEVNASSASTVKTRNGEPGVFASARAGSGKISVLTDARLFRNRWIDEKEHAALLQGILRATEFTGAVGFIRGSGVSFWTLLARHLWPVLIGLGVLTVLWLWKNFTRFGPVEAASSTSALRGYDHHLEALGDFQWRLDKAAALLVPLRAEIVEKGQRIASRSGKRDEDFFQFLSDRSGIPRERVNRALTEAAPADAAILIRTAADLQSLLNILH